MNLKTTFPSKLFSSQVPDVVMSTSSTRVHVVIAFGGNSIYDENLYPDTEGTITIGELSELVMPFARHSLVAELSITLTEQTVTKAADGSENIADDWTNASNPMKSSIVYCTAEVSEDATTFCNHHFLTRLQGAKITALGRLEYLHYDSTDVASVTAYYNDGTTSTFSPPLVGGNGTTYSTIDVSPSKFINNTKTLYRYIVAAGSRNQTFDIDFNQPDAAPILLFTNCFGCQELVYCTGLHQVKPEFKYQSVYIKGLLRNYDFEETRPFSADTGVLTFPMADWISDLFRSDEIYIVNFINGIPATGRMVIILDPKSDLTNAEDELPRFTFTYRYSRRNHNIIDLSRAGRVFDNTFDFTFN